MKTHRAPSPLIRPIIPPVNFGLLTARTGSQRENVLISNSENLKALKEIQGGSEILSRIKRKKDSSTAASLSQAAKESKFYKSNF